MKIKLEEMLVMEKYSCRDHTWGYENRYDFEVNEKGVSIIYEMLEQDPKIHGKNIYKKIITANFSGMVPPVGGYNKLEHGEQVKDNDIVFVGLKGGSIKYNLMKFFKEIFPKINCQFNLGICENSDDGDYEFVAEYLNDDRIRKFCFPSGNTEIFKKSHFIPFGLSMWNIHLGMQNRNGVSPLIEACTDSIPKTKIMLGCFSEYTGGERKDLKRIAGTWNFCDIIPTQKASESESPHLEYNGMNSYEEKLRYFRMNKEYRFVLCPPGADTQKNYYGTSSRVWESLYLGCIPVVRKTQCSVLFEDLPVLLVDRWDDLDLGLLNDFWKDYLEKRKNGDYKYEKLTMSYWLEKIRK